MTKVAYETLSTPNISIFIEALKLYTTIFYAGKGANRLGQYVLVMKVCSNNNL